MFVPVKTTSGKKLMPTHPNKAGMLIKKGLATPYWSNGIFCIRLNYVTEDEYTQDIVVGVDPGSQKEGLTVKSASHTYLNIQADAHNKVGKKVAKRRELRRSRRSRKCPNRKQRKNRNAGKEKIPAGTRARWDWKLRILDWLSKLYPVTHVCVEDMKARTIERAKQWNQSFSPLEVGKQWFYAEIRKRWQLLTLQGWQTKEIRDRLGLKKSSNKLSETFSAHCIDSWCLAHHSVGGVSMPENTDIFCIAPIPIKRRSLHREQETKGRQRNRYGGTVLGKGLVKNTLINHAKYGLTRLAGVNAKGLFSIYTLEGKRLTTGAKRNDFRVLRRLNFNYRNGHSSQT
ncbi:MAG: RRXRR domain-containing protein [Candidatus Poribacteria bacterium]|nr:RRXRR domain-containing protein [Candidatus Poribacteria bacterium]